MSLRGIRVYGILASLGVVLTAAACLGLARALRRADPGEMKADVPLDEVWQLGTAPAPGWHLVSSAASGELLTDLRIDPGVTPQRGTVTKRTAKTDHSVSMVHLYPEFQLRPSPEARGCREFAPVAGMQLEGGPGSPALPVAPVRLLIPPGEEIERIVVRSAGLVEVPGVHRVRSTALDADSAKSGPPAASAATEPARLASAIGVQRKKGHAIVMLNLNPVQYQAASGRLAYHQALSVTVKTRPAAGLARVRPRGNATREMARLIDNPEMLDAYRLAATAPRGGIAPAGILTDPADSYQYVVVAPEAFRDATTDYRLQDLMALRTAQGLSSTLVTIEDILANYSGADDAAKLRNFVIDAYNDWETDYVLLVGDTNVMPYRTMRVEVGTSLYDEPASDWYFQCLDGDFDYNANGYYGELDDGELAGMPDILTEVWVGRASVEDATEMSNFVYKTLTYENLPRTDGSLYRTIVASERGADKALYEETLIVGAWGQLFYASTRPPYPFSLGASGPPSLAMPGYMTPYRLYTFGGDSGPDDWTGATIAALINSDRYASIHTGGLATDTGASLRMTSADADALTNTKPFFAYDQGRRAGNFAADCIAEHLTTSTRSGAVAAIMCSGEMNQSWWGDPETCQDQVHRMLIKAQFEDGLERAGAANAASKELMASVSTGRPECLRAFYAANLLGDPALRLPGLTDLPILAVTGTAFTDPVGNGDGVINAGETIDLKVALKNWGVAAADNVTATVSTSSPYVTMVTGSASYGSLPAGGATATNTPDYRFTVDSGCPPEQSVTFDIHITDDAGHAWDRDFTLMVRSVYPNVVLPASLTATCASGSQVTRTLTVGNSGNASLRYAVMQSNGQEMAVLRNIALDWHEWYTHDGVAWTPDGVWVTALRSPDSRSFQLKLDTNDGIILEAIDVEAVTNFAMGMCHDGTDFWIVRASDFRIFRVRTTDGSPVSSFPSSASGALAWNGTHVCAIARQESAINLLRYDPDGHLASNVALPQRTPGLDSLAWDGCLFWGTSRGYGYDGYSGPGGHGLYDLMAFDAQGNIVRLIKNTQSYEGLTFDGMHFWAESGVGVRRLNSGCSSWLSPFSKTGNVSGGSSGDVTLTFNASGLSPGTYTTSLKVATNDNETPEVDVPVTFVVTSPPEITSFSPTTPWTMVAGTSQEFSVVADDPDGDTLTHAWEIDGEAAGADSSSMTYSPAEADVGARVIKVTVTDGHGGSDSQTWEVTVTTAIPAIALSTAALTPACNEGQDAGQQTFDVWNSGGNTLSYTVSDDAAWLSCSPASGSSTGEHDVITVTYDTDTLAPGTHTATITVADAGASNTPQTVSVTLTVGALPRIGLSPATLVPTCRQGQTAAAQTFEVWNSGVDTLSYTISDDVDWLSCTTASGTSTGEHDPITVAYDTSALAAGTHTATITVADAGAANTPQTIAVTLTVTRKSSSGGGSGCALAATPAGAAGLAGWLLPYLAAAGLYALSRTRRRRG